MPTKICSRDLGKPATFIQESITSESPTSTASRESSSCHTLVKMVLLKNQSRNQVLFVTKGGSISNELPFKTAEDREEKEEEEGEGREV